VLYSKTRILHKRANIQFRAFSDRLNKVCRDPWEVKLQVIVVAATTAHWDMISSVRLVIPYAPSGADTGTVSSHIYSNWPYGSTKHKRHATAPLQNRAEDDFRLLWQSVKLRCRGLSVLVYPPRPAVCARARVCVCACVAFCRSSSSDRVAVMITEKHRQPTRNIKHFISRSALKFLIHKGKMIPLQARCGPEGG